MSERLYRPELDVVRLIACLCVFFYHALPNGGENHSGWWVHPAVEFVRSLSFGVCLFFVLSAYLITLLLLREQDQTGDIHLPQFYKRRILRIWPLYFFALTAGAAISYLDGTLYANRWWFLGALCLCANFIKSSGLWILHLWTISVEEQFYLLWPPVMKNLGRRYLAFAAIAIILISSLYLQYSALKDLPWPSVWSNSLAQFEMFAAGALLALADHKLPHPTARRSLLMICLAGTLGYAAALVFHMPSGQHGHPLGRPVGYSMVAIACMLLIAGMPRGIKWPKWILHGGKISYGIYVFHFPILIGALRLPIPRALTISGSLVLTCVCALISYRFLETPFLRLKQRFELVKSRPL